MRHDAAALDKRRAIGDQKRAWRVKFFTASGKPKKRLQANDDDPMAQAHTGVYCGGTANLLAFEDTEKHRIGSDEALEALDDKIRLQSWLNQVAQVEQLFEPLAEPLARMHRAASDLNDVDGRAFTRVCMGEEEAPPPIVVEAQPPVVESTALAVVPGSPADESYDFFGDASRPESPARIAWEPPPRAPPKRVYMPKRRTRRPPVSRVPWSLLDELDAEKEKFAMQQVGDTFKDRFEAADAKKKRVRQRFVE